jgi:hypothetical protein
MRIYELRPCRDERRVDLISDALPFGRLWYAEPNAIFARSGSRLRSQELNGDYPGPVFTNQHGTNSRLSAP